ncbi:MAG: hypothetical protein K8T91_05460 [Planctomycetes bacterium]|nr:hypothetical protein [Planctomycetota bacterium]
MSRFVLLWHETPTNFARSSHWDLMLEFGGHLRCWALSHAPDQATEQAIDGLPDHRLAYLDHQGPVSGERGSVSRHDQGAYETITDDENELVVRLQGERMQGTLTLRRESAADQRWRLSFVPD